MAHLRHSLIENSLVDSRRRNTWASFWMDWLVFYSYCNALTLCQVPKVSFALLPKGKLLKEMGQFLCWR